MHSETPFGFIALVFIVVAMWLGSKETITPVVINSTPCVIVESPKTKTELICDNLLRTKEVTQKEIK